MWWFTDHGPMHSYRVAEYARRIATVKVLHKSQRLTLQERYLLEMASWLHDIGMQSHVPTDAPADPDFSAEPDVVRSMHATYSHQLLIRKIVQTGIPSNFRTTLECIATLARAHGTHTYDDAVGVLREQFATLNKEPIRGPLLAAILLMADELDLHSERVTPRSGPQGFGPVSDAHWLKHECVDDVQVDEYDRKGGAGPLVQIRVALRSFSNMTPTQVDVIETWISDKLVAQIARTEREFIEGFDNCFHFDKSIYVPRPLKGKTENPRVSDDALAVMWADNARFRLINHTKCMKKAIKTIRSSKSLVLVGSDPASNDEGREDLFRYLLAVASMTGLSVCEVPQAIVLGATPTVSDVLAAWLRDLGVDNAADESLHEIERRVVLLEALIGRLDQRLQPTLLALSSVDTLTPGDRSWLLETAVPALTPRSATFALSSSDRVRGAKKKSDWRTVHMGETPELELQAFLARYVPGSVATKMVLSGTTYSTVRAHAVLGGQL